MILGTGTLEFEIATSINEKTTTKKKKKVCDSIGKNGGGLVVVMEMKKTWREFLSVERRKQKHVNDFWMDVRFVRIQKGGLLVYIHKKRPRQTTFCHLSIFLLVLKS